MKQPYLSAEMEIQPFYARDVINCSDSDAAPDITHPTTPTTTEEWIPTCNQGKPDYNAWN